MLFPASKVSHCFDGKISRGQSGIVAIGVSAVIGDRCYPPVIEVYSRAVSAAVPYLNYNTKPLFFNGKNSFLPKEEKTAAQKRRSRTRSDTLRG